MLSGSSTLAVFHTSGTLPVAKIYLGNDGQSQRYFFPAFKSPREQFYLVLVVYPLFKILVYPLYNILDPFSFIINVILF